jgi:hypothetical protein
VATALGWLVQVGATHKGTVRVSSLPRETTITTLTAQITLPHFFLKKSKLSILGRHKTLFFFTSGEIYATVGLSKTQTYS